MCESMGILGGGGYRYIYRRGGCNTHREVRRGGGQGRDDVYATLYRHDGYYYDYE